MAPAPGIRRSLVWTMAVASGLSVANLYYCQPLLADMGRSFHVDASGVGAIPMLTQVGYAIGLFLFVPLGDLMERRRLIMAVLAAVAVALGGVALAPSLAWLATASLLTGITTIVPQLLLPMAANLAAENERGKVVGSVMGGLLIGVLLARTVSGFVGAQLGWRAMYGIAAGMMLALAAALRFVLPRGEPSLTLSYPELLRSMARLVREQGALREAAAFGGLVFGAFSAFWSTLVFLLERPPYHYGSRAAGLFGLVGVVGALAAPIVGRLSDTRSPRTAAGAGQLIVLLSFGAFWLWGHQLWGLVLGVTLLDLGTQANQGANQARIYGLVPSARSRLNTVYMVSYFVGGALGTVLATHAWSAWGWPGVCATGALMAGLALVIHRAGSRQAARLSPA